MIFKVRKLGDEVCQTRGYRKEGDIPYIFVCTFYKSAEQIMWEVQATLSSSTCTRREMKEIFEFIENFPGGTFTWVSKRDFERFYKKHYFVCIDFAKRIKKGNIMLKFPQKGRTVPLQKIEEICNDNRWYDLWEKIAEDPPIKPFKSDGCSWWPDEWKAASGERVSIYPRCFKHDLWYWCGHSEKGNIKEQIVRFKADTELVIGVVEDTERIDLGDMMWSGVRIGGHERWHMPFSWSFGRK